jgi:hypothetical protein
MSDQKQAERRTWRRHAVEARARLLLGGEGARAFVAGVTNISEGGCYVNSPEEVRVGIPVKLRFESPSGELTVWGHVTHVVAGKGFGVRFTAYAHGRQLLAALLGGAR